MIRLHFWIDALLGCEDWSKKRYKIVCRQYIKPTVCCVFIIMVPNLRLFVVQSRHHYSGCLNISVFVTRRLPKCRIIFREGIDPWFLFMGGGGGRGAQDYVRARTSRARSHCKVPYGRGPCRARVRGKLSGVLMLSEPSFFWYKMG